MRLLRLWGKVLVAFKWHRSYVKKEQPDRIPAGLRRRHAG